MDNKLEQLERRYRELEGLLSDPAVLANPAVYPDEATLKRLWAPAPLDDDQNAGLTRAWSDIKSG